MAYAQASKKAESFKLTLNYISSKNLIEVKRRSGSVCGKINSKNGEVEFAESSWKSEVEEIAAAYSTKKEAEPKLLGNAAYSNSNPLRRKDQSWEYDSIE
jgi:hypothetical protein